MPGLYLNPKYNGLCKELFTTAKDIERVEIAIEQGKGLEGYNKSELKGLMTKHRTIMQKLDRMEKRNA